jgi:hypothetical protein
VTDIFVSHLSPGHSGGLFDFPDARLHGIALPPRARVHELMPAPERLQLPQGPGFFWHGLAAYRLQFEDLELYLVPLPGVFQAHAGIVIPTANGRLFHVGCALQSLTELRESRSFSSELRSALLTDKMPFSRLETRSQLRAISRNGQARVTFCATFDANDGAIPETFEPVTQAPYCPSSPPTLSQI